MAIQKPPAGTRGGRGAPGFIMRIMTPILIRIHKRSGDKLKGMDVLYLHTVGARSGSERIAPVARMDDGHGGWLVCASANGAAKHPGWYHNVVAHPDQVSAEFGGHTQPVDVVQLEGDERAEGWSRIISVNPGFDSYLKRTDRELPVLRLTPRG